MRAAKRPIVFEPPANAFVIGDCCFAVWSGLADEHHVIACGEKLAVLIERDLHVSQSVLWLREIDSDALPAGDGSGGAFLQLRR